MSSLPSLLGIDDRWGAVPYNICSAPPLFPSLASIGATQAESIDPRGKGYEHPYTYKGRAVRRQAGEELKGGRQGKTVGGRLEEEGQGHN
jgi:hypothetical protein